MDRYRDSAAASMYVNVSDCVDSGCRWITCDLGIMWPIYCLLMICLWNVFCCCESSYETLICWRLLTWIMPYHCAHITWSNKTVNFIKTAMYHNSQDMSMECNLQEFTYSSLISLFNLCPASLNQNMRHPFEARSTADESCRHMCSPE